MDDDPSSVAVNNIKFNCNFIKHSLHKKADCVFLLFFGGIRACNIPHFSKINLKSGGKFL